LSSSLSSQHPLLAKALAIAIPKKNFFILSLLVT